jgi:hypothetical protein
LMPPEPARSREEVLRNDLLCMLFF